MRNCLRNRKSLCILYPKDGRGASSQAEHLMLSGRRGYKAQAVLEEERCGRSPEGTGKDAVAVLLL